MDITVELRVRWVRVRALLAFCRVAALFIGKERAAQLAERHAWRCCRVFVDGREAGLR